MKSKVYFIGVKDARDVKDTAAQLDRLIAKSRVLDCIRKGWNVAVKTHFGEAGNTGFVKPPYVRAICDGIKGKGAAAFLSDANTLYRGRRLNSADHLALAAEHGFTKETVGVDIVIPDDTKKENTIALPINQKNITFAKVARVYADADALVTVTHFKGHILTGFGGSVKNVGMGCATREGKLAQHCDAAPTVYPDKCIGCGACVKICPVDAIRVVNKKSVLSVDKCIGCASCMAVCPTMALFIDFNAGDKVQEKMAEYALAVLKAKKGKAVFFNFAVDINKECDCWGQDNPRIAPDVGIFASDDPVSVDKAGYDVVNAANGRDIFREAHPDYDGVNHLRYAREIGLGSLDYELIRL